MASRSSRVLPKAGTSPDISDISRAFVAEAVVEEPPHFLGHRARLRDRFLNGGADTFPLVGQLADFAVMRTVSGTNVGILFER